MRITTLRKSRVRGKASRAPSGVFAVLGSAIALGAALAVKAADDWAFYGHDADGQRFLPLNQVSAANEMRF